MRQSPIKGIGKKIFHIARNIIMFTIVLGFVSIPLTVLGGDALNLGMVDSKPSKIIKTFKPLLDYLGTKGITTGKVVVTKTLDQMAQKFQTGGADFMFESPFGSLELMDKAEVIPILIREKKGVKEYNAVIFVPKDSPIKALEDLKGKVVAFEDPASTSSYMLPKNILISAGLKLKESRKPVPGYVAYYFSKDDDNTVVQVKAGKKADAGGIKKNAVGGNPDFRILEPESAMVPRHVVLVRKDFNYEQLKKILLDMKNDPAGAKVLKSIKTPTGFSEFSDDPIKIMNIDVKKALGL